MTSLCTRYLSKDEKYAYAVDTFIIEDKQLKPHLYIELNSAPKYVNLGYFNRAFPKDLDISGFDIIKEKIHSSRRKSYVHYCGIEALLEKIFYYL